MPDFIRHQTLAHRFDRTDPSHSRGILVLPLLLLVGVLGGGTLSCSGDTLNGPAPISPTQAYWALQLNYHAIDMATVAPYDTVQLTVTSLNAAGTPLNSRGPVTYTAADTSVTVSPTGLVTAHTATTNTVIVAALQDTVQSVTHYDTVYIQVTDTVPRHPLAHFSLQAAPGDSAKRGYSSASFVWPVTATDAVGDTVCNAKMCALTVYYTSSDPTVATIRPNTGQVFMQDTGHVTFTATTLAYGVQWRDSVMFTIGNPTSYEVDLSLALLLGVLTLGFAAPRKLVLGVGAVITFCNKTPQPVDIQFDHTTGIDTASCVIEGEIGPPTGDGNIPAFGGDTTTELDPGLKYSNFNDCAARRFTVPAVYHYHSSLFPSDTYEIDIDKN